jgi:hypothetical protein
MKAWLELIGLLLGMAGTFTAVKGTFTTTAAIIKQRWSDVEKSWEKGRPSWFQRISCHIAYKFGSSNPLDTQDYTVETFITNFWAFILLFFGFLLQLIALLMGLGLFCTANEAVQW